MKFKIFKTKDFTMEDGREGTFYSVILAGRFFGITSTNFEKENLKVADGEITVKGDIELIGKKAPALDGTESRIFVHVVPKCPVPVAASVPVV